MLREDQFLAERFPVQYQVKDPEKSELFLRERRSVWLT